MALKSRKLVTSYLIYMGSPIVFNLAIGLSQAAFADCSLLSILKRITGELTFPNETDEADQSDTRPEALTRLGS